VEPVFCTLAISDAGIALRALKQQDVAPCRLLVAKRIGGNPERSVDTSESMWNGDKNKAIPVTGRGG
jgi:hypothetical protein